MRPLEVVQQRPDEVAAELDAPVQRVERRPEVPTEERDASGVARGVVVIHGIRGAVLGDVQGEVPGA